MRILYGGKIVSTCHVQDCSIFAFEQVCLLVIAKIGKVQILFVHMDRQRKFGKVIRSVVVQ